MSETLRNGHTQTPPNPTLERCVWGGGEGFLLGAVRPFDKQFRVYRQLDTSLMSAEYIR